MSASVRNSTTWNGFASKNSPHLENLKKKNKGFEVEKDRKEKNENKKKEKTEGKLKKTTFIFFFHFSLCNQSDKLTTSSQKKKFFFSLSLFSFSAITLPSDPPLTHSPTPLNPLRLLQLYMPFFFLHYENLLTFFFYPLPLSPILFFFWNLNEYTRISEI